ncbi:hypothetical protein D3C80_1833270 [compost metagenome]
MECLTDMLKNTIQEIMTGDTIDGIEKIVMIIVVIETIKVTTEIEGIEEIEVTVGAGINKHTLKPIEPDQLIRLLLYGCFL